MTILFMARVVFLFSIICSISCSISKAVSSSNDTACTEEVKDPLSIIMQNFTVKKNDAYHVRYLENLKLDSSIYHHTTLNFTFPYRISLNQRDSVESNPSTPSADCRRRLFDQLMGMTQADLYSLLNLIFTGEELLFISGQMKSRNTYWGIEFSSNDGFSVVAPTRIIVPFSTTGKKASCWD